MISSIGAENPPGGDVLIHEPRAVQVLLYVSAGDATIEQALEHALAAVA
jgi:hypothetical protein